VLFKNKEKQNLKGKLKIKGKTTFLTRKTDPPLPSIRAISGASEETLALVAQRCLYLVARLKNGKQRGLRNKPH